MKGKETYEIQIISSVHFQVIVTPRSFNSGDSGIESVPRIQAARNWKVTN